jgi:hypothetical protein
MATDFRGDNLVGGTANGSRPRDRQLRESPRVASGPLREVRIAVRVCPLLFLLAMGACGEDPPEVEPLTCGETFKDIPFAPPRPIDLLIVIDTAPSMAGEQASMAVNARRFANVIESMEGGLPDLHLAVVTSDLGAGGFTVAGCAGEGDGGAFHTPPECNVDGDFLVHHDFLDGTSETNYSGEFADAVACMADVGVGTCAIRQPVAAALQALAHPGFLRDEAYLSVVFISDGDDCSAAHPTLFDPDRGDLGMPVEFRCFEHGIECDPDDARIPGAKQGCEPREISLVQPIDGQTAALRAVKPDPARVIVSLVAGLPGPVVVADDLTLAPTCTSATAEAGPAIRLGALTEGFPQRNTVTTVCNEDLSDALVVLAGWPGEIIFNPCMEGDIDRDPAAPGTQAECVVSDVRFPGEDRQEERLIPACADTDELPCWRLEEDRASCPSTPTSTVLQIERHDYPPSGTHTQIRCLTLC